MCARMTLLVSLVGVLMLVSRPHGGVGVDPRPGVFPVTPLAVDAGADLPGARGAESPARAVKWAQPPGPAEPEHVYYGWNELSLYGLDQIAADDWRCVTDEPVTAIRWWGSFEGWRQAVLPPEMVPPYFHLAIWTDVPAGVDTDFSHPGEVVWALFCDAFTWQFAGWDFDPRTGTYEACFEFYAELTPEHWFYQDPGSAEGTVFWLSVGAGYVWDPPYENWGWKTRPRDPDSPAPDDAVVIVEPVFPWVGMVYEQGWPIEFPAGVSWDLAFELIAEPAGALPKWSQPPEPFLPDDAFTGWNEPSVYGGEQIVADDWFCETDKPVTGIEWWGSFLGWGDVDPPQLPDAFHIGIWTDVPAGPDELFSHPGQLIHQIHCPDFTCELAGWDWDPRDPAAPPEACFRFHQELAEEDWFFQGSGESIFWVSISAVYLAVPPEHVWGWKTRPRDVDSPAPDDAVRIFDPTAPDAGTDVYVAGEPIWWPAPEDSWDLAFVLESPNIWPKPKWIQWPDLTDNGIDVRVDSDLLRVMADDFECTSTGPITHVRLWNSWYNDSPGEITWLRLSFWANDPAGPGGYSTPAGDAPLWAREFGPGEFTQEVHAWLLPGAWWWDPAYEYAVPTTDEHVWQVDVPIDPADAFIQTGMPDEPTIYWLGVEVQTAGGEFGWKTREWPDHFMDDAVWHEGELPWSWRELRYPPGHPYHGLEKDSIDFAFMLSGDGVVPALEPKWVQPPHGGGDGFDAASNYWWPEPPPKWTQPPDPELPGLHAHDAMGPAGVLSWTTLADDWVCEGGAVTGGCWYGNYELDEFGVEKRGSGIDHFHLSIHLCAGGMPWCLPLDPEVVGLDIAFADLGEAWTGLVNSEGSRIYRYDYTLPEPFPQQPGMHYWLDLEAHSQDPFDPAVWRWQEARRDVAPPLGLAPAAERFTEEGLPPGPWQSIVWTLGDPERYSDLAFEVEAVSLAPPEVNKVMADDFISDGRPVRAVRWWGSYFDEQYAPDHVSVEPYVLDGWFISFHHDGTDGSDPLCPPDGAAGDVPTVLGVYFAPADAVTIMGLDMQDCLGHGVYEYVVDLNKCCLLCSEMDPRTGEWPAEAGAFHETAELTYWLDIVAVVGVTWHPPACGFDDRILTGHLPSPLTPEGHFWGWLTSPNGAMPFGPLQEACSGRILDPGPYPPDCWIYGDWTAEPWQCPDVPQDARVDLAFELLAPAWPVIGAVASCRTHDDGSAPQEFCLALGLGDQSGSHGDNVEPRLGGIRKLRLEMTQPLDPATVHGGNVQVGCPAGYSGAVTAALDPSGLVPTVIVEFSPGLPDEDCCRIGLAGMTSLAGEPVTDACFVAGLEGDVLQDGLVNSLDASAIKPRYGDVVTATNARYDVFTDKVINSLDSSAIKPRFGNNLPGPCPDLP